MQWFRNFPMVHSPRLKRGDAILTLTILFALVGFLLLLLALFTVNKKEVVLYVWLGAFALLVLAYAAKKMSFAVGPVKISTHEEAEKPQKQEPVVQPKEHLDGAPIEEELPPE